MIESVFAALGLLVCAGLLLRMGLPPAQRQRWDRFWHRRLERLQVTGRWLRRQWQLLRSSGGARREAERAIERARGAKVEVDRDGNVIRPRNFRRSDATDDKKPPLH